MAITQTQIDGIDKERKEAIWQGSNLGALKPDSLKIGLKGVYTPVKIDQLTSTIKSFLEGFDITIQMTIMDTSVEYLNGVLMQNQITGLISATGVPAVGFGNRKRSLSATTSGELLLHEYGVANSDRSKDFIFWCAEPMFDNTELAYGGTTIKEVVVTFMVFADLSKTIDFQIGMYGDWAAYADQTVPKGVWIQNSKVAMVPGKSLTALTLTSYQYQDLEYMAGFANVDATRSAALNDATDISAIDVAVIIDTEVGDAIAAGDYITLDTEIMYVRSRASQTLQVTRGVWGSTAATHLDNVAIAVYKEVAVMRVTDIATNTSSVAGDVVIGTIYQGTGSTKLGRITWVSDGASNIVATYNTKASPTLVVTTTT